MSRVLRELTNGKVHINAFLNKSGRKYKRDGSTSRNNLDGI